MQSLTAKQQRLLTAILAILSAALVLNFAWVSDDCFITFRHLQNLWAGNGPVFNAGERVQGYTHPLWFWTLALGQLLIRDPVLLSIGLGVGLTCATVWLLARLILHEGQGSRQSAALLILCVGVLWSSDAFLSFQTAGLENPLSHFLLSLLARELQLHGWRRVGRVSLLWALLGTNRLDFAAACLPSVLLVLWTLRDPRRWLRVLAGALPIMLWLIGAWLYYGDPLPNTAHAKVGIFPNSAVALFQGLSYLQDWISHEPIAAAATAMGIGLGLWRLRASPLLALPLGALSHIAYVLWVGGDFMRGRFWLVALVLGVTSGALALPGLLREHAPVKRRLSLVWLGSLLVLLVDQTGRDRQAQRFISDSGIVDERLFYPNFQLRSYLASGPNSGQLNVDFLEQLKRYSELCGPTTLHSPHPGTIAALAGPKVLVIDTLGLTDSYIAALPAEYLVERRPRVGHPEKRIPISYLAGRADIALIQDWQSSVLEMDCGLREAPLRYAQDPGLWEPEQPPLPSISDNPE